MSTGAKYVAAASGEPSDEPIVQKRVGKTGANEFSLSIFKYLFADDAERGRHDACSNFRSAFALVAHPEHIRQ